MRYLPLDVDGLKLVNELGHPVACGSCIHGDLTDRKQLLLHLVALIRVLFLVCFGFVKLFRLLEQLRYLGLHLFIQVDLLSHF